MTIRPGWRPCVTQANPEFSPLSWRLILPNPNRNSQPSRGSRLALWIFGVALGSFLTDTIALQTYTIRVSPSAGSITNTHRRDYRTAKPSDSPPRASVMPRRPGPPEAGPAPHDRVPEMLQYCPLVRSAALSMVAAAAQRQGTRRFWHSACSLWATCPTTRPRWVPRL
jgi:hypothetical protein